MTEKKATFKLEPLQIPQHLDLLKGRLCAPIEGAEDSSGYTCADSFTVEDIVKPYLSSAPVVKARLFEIGAEFGSKISVDAENETETLHVIDSADEWKALERATLQMDLALVEAFAERSGDINAWKDVTPELARALVKVVNLATQSIEHFYYWKAGGLSCKDFVSYVNDPNSNIRFPQELLKACKIFSEINFTHLKEKSVVERWLSTGSLPLLVSELVFNLMRYDNVMSKGFPDKVLPFKLSSKTWGDVSLAFIAFADRSPEMVEPELLKGAMILAKTEAVEDILWPYFYGPKPAQIMEDVLERGDLYESSIWNTILQDAVANGHPYAQGVLRDLISSPLKIPDGKKNWREIYKKDFQPFFYGAFQQVFEHGGGSNIPSVRRFHTEMQDMLGTMMRRDSSAYAGSFVWMMMQTNGEKFTELVQSYRAPANGKRDRLQLNSLRAFMEHPSCMFEKLLLADQIDDDLTSPFVQLAKAGYGDEVLEFLEGFIDDGSIVTGFALEVLRKIAFGTEGYGVTSEAMPAYDRIREDAKKYLRESVPEGALVDYMEEFEDKYTELRAITDGGLLILRVRGGNRYYRLDEKKSEEHMDSPDNQSLFDGLLVGGRGETSGDGYSFDSLYKAFAQIARSKYLSWAVINTLGDLDESGDYGDLAEDDMDPLSLLKDIVLGNRGKRGDALEKIIENFQNFVSDTYRADEFQRRADALQEIFESTGAIGIHRRMDILTAMLTVMMKNSDNEYISNILLHLDVTALYNEMNGGTPEGWDEDHFVEVSGNCWQAIGKLASLGNESAFGCLEVGLLEGNSGAAAALQELMSSDVGQFGEVVLDICFDAIGGGAPVAGGIIEAIFEVIKKGAELGIARAWEGLWEIYKDDSASDRKLRILSAKTLISTGHYLAELNEDIAATIEYYLEQDFQMDEEWFDEWRPIVQGLAGKGYPESMDAFKSLEAMWGIVSDDEEVVQQNGGVTVEKRIDEKEIVDQEKSIENEIVDQEKSIENDNIIKNKISGVGENAIKNGDASDKSYGTIVSNIPYSGRDSLGKITIPKGFKGQILIGADGILSFSENEGDDHVDGAMMGASASIERARLLGYIEALIDVALDESAGDGQRYKAVDDLKLLSLFAENYGVQALESIAGQAEDDDIAAYAVAAFAQLADGAQNPQAFIAEIGAEQGELQNLDAASVAPVLGRIKQMIINYIELCKDTVIESNEESARKALETIHLNATDTVIREAAEKALTAVGPS